MNINIIKKGEARKRLSENFLERAVQPFAEVVKHKDLPLSEIFDALTLRRKPAKGATAAKEMLRQNKRKQLPASASIFRYRLWDDGKYHKEYLSDEEVLERFAPQKRKRGRPRHV
ncbi:MAG: hypothetical protein NC350_05095 [Corallococcus sp.]|nr:hypothetical protein [Corallococcus sp.]